MIIVPVTPTVYLTWQTRGLPKAGLDRPAPTSMQDCPQLGSESTPRVPLCIPVWIMQPQPCPLLLYVIFVPVRFQLGQLLLRNKVVLSSHAIDSCYGYIRCTWFWVGGEQVPLSECFSGTSGARFYYSSNTQNMPPKRGKRMSIKHSSPTKLKHVVQFEWWPS